MEGENVIIFSSDDWASGLKTSKYHIARHLARRNRVLFVNSVGLRAPRASGRDLRRIASKLAGFFKGPARVPEGLHVWTPIVVPFARRSRLTAGLNRLVWRASMRRLQSALGLAKPVAFAFAPIYNDAIDCLDAKAVAYYCIDDLRGYAGVDRDWFDRQEDEMIARADCVIASSAELVRAFEAGGHSAHHVPHGVEWGLFRTAVTEPLPVPEDLRAIPEPRLGFYGFLSEEWVDYELLDRMAAEHPEWHVVLIGRPGPATDMDAVTARANVHFLGLKPFESLPAYTRHFAAGLVPFRNNELTRSSNPLKMLEYLSGGLPVVSTDIPEVRAYADEVHVAGTHEEFISMCERALTESDPDARDRRSRAAEQHSWDHRVEDIGRIVLGSVADSVPEPEPACAP